MAASYQPAVIAALIDNGSRAPAAHLNLRALAAALSARTSIPVHAVSWQYSDGIPADALGGVPAPTLGPWLRAQVVAGKRDFVFVPFLINPQGAVAARLRREAEFLRQELGARRIGLTPGLDAAAVAHVTACRIRETIQARALRCPAVVLVDHGGPSASSARLRDRVAAEVRHLLGGEIRALIAGSLGGARYAHNHPSYAEVFTQAGFDRGDIVVAPLFLAPGRHAGPAGDLVRIAARVMRQPDVTCHFAQLIGTHPAVIQILADGLRSTVARMAGES